MKRPSRLIYVDVEGAGKQIYADAPDAVDCVEYTLKPGRQMIATSPWIQFPPKEWDEMVNTLFTEMVDAWNEKYGDGSRASDNPQTEVGSGQ